MSLTCMIALAYLCRTSEDLRTNVMMDKENGNKRPPYPPYAQWLRLLETLKDDFRRRQLPSRIDNSYLKKLKVNPSAESNLQSALTFLGLVDGEKQPTEALKLLLPLNGEEAQAALREIIRQAYAPMLKGLILHTVTPDHLAEKFRRGGSQDEVGRKGMTFFVKIAKDAGIKLSDQLKTRDRQPGPRTPRRRAPQPGPALPVVTELPSPVPQHPQTAPSDNADLLTRLLAKFPDYDPDWDQVQVELWRDSLALLLAEARNHYPTPD